MTAPHFHTASEAKHAISKVEHNRDNTGGAGTGAPTGISDGSTKNLTTKTKGVHSESKGSDWVSKRGIKSAT